MFKPMNHRGKILFTSTPDVPSTSDTKNLLLHKGYYLSETTIQIYIVHPWPIQGYIAVVTIIHLTTKVGYPFMRRITNSESTQLIFEYLIVADPHFDTEIDTYPLPSKANQIIRNPSNNCVRINLILRNHISQDPWLWLREKPNPITINHNINHMVCRKRMLTLQFGLKTTR